MNESALTQLSQLTRLAGGEDSSVLNFASVATGIGRLTTVFVNVYAIDVPGGWVLVDTGIPGLAGHVRAAAERRYGLQPPTAIVLTHGHFDHAGNAKALAEQWDVPVYAHRLELPYLTGQCDYPPQDPTPGGAICFLSRFFPTSGTNLGERVRALPGNSAGQDGSESMQGSAPPLPGWQWIHTPGHTAGHISLWRESDRTLIAGDALTTTDLDSWGAQSTWPRELSRPPTPFTPDWHAARKSVRRLAQLNPHAIAAGHGLPMTEDFSRKLRTFAEMMPEPVGGRYSEEPVRYHHDGSVASVPPPVPDALPKQLALGAAAAVVITGAAALLGRRTANRGA